jgi:hypothetical protein
MLKPFEREGIETIADAWPIDFALHPSSTLQNLQMLGNGALRERQNLDDFAANAALALMEQSHNRGTRRMPKRLRQTRKFFVLGMERKPRFARITKYLIHRQS